MVLRNSIDAERLISMARANLITAHRPGGKGRYEAEVNLRTLLEREGAIMVDEVGSLLTCNEVHVQFMCPHVTRQSDDPPVVTVHEDGSWERV